MSIKHFYDRMRRRAARRLRWAAGRMQGDAYRISGAHPAYAVPDRVLAERIRAQVGSELKHGPDAKSWVEERGHIAYLRGHAAGVVEARHLEERAACARRGRGAVLSRGRRAPGE